jgi:hypothetical protein
MPQKRLSDLKYVPRVTKHVCHSIGTKHLQPCLVEIFILYIGLVESQAKRINAFYFKPCKSKFSYEKVPVGINTLNTILPEMCEAAGVKRKTANSLRVTCASSLFNSGIQEKLGGQAIAPTHYFSTKSPHKRMYLKFRLY